MNSPFLRSVVEAIRTRHYSIRTEHSYLQWIKQFIRFHGLRHPSELSAKDVEAFLTYLAVKRNVSASTQTQALCAIVFGLAICVSLIQVEHRPEIAIDATTSC
jgi:hypothetical protein